MTAREDVLRRVRAALSTADRGPLHPQSQQSADDDGSGIPRDYAHTREVPDLVGLFVERVEDYRATVIRAAPADVAQAVAQSLDGARRVVVPSGLDASWLPDGLDVVGDEPVLSAGDLDSVDAVVTSATVAIAETGTIVLDHTDGQGRRALTLVPDIHVCVVSADQVVGDVPEGVGRLQASVTSGRPLTWISGPSATSDIELDRVEGVHGPRTLRVVVVDPSLSSASSSTQKEAGTR